jgi:hypothetical protein
MTLLKFKDWDNLNEANVFDKIKTWFSTNFGGVLSRIEDLLSEYRSAETDYVDEWGKIVEEIDKLELQRAQTKSDPAEVKKIDRYIQRNRQLIEDMKKAHVKKIDHLMVKVKKEIADSRKLQSYWEVNKTRIDAEVADDMLKRSKQLANVDLSGSLYSKYKEAVVKAREKDLEFKEKYGDLLGGQKKPQATPSSKTSKSGFSEAALDLYISMSLSDFTKEVEDLDTKEKKEVTSYLLKQRNDLYVQMEMEKESANLMFTNDEIKRDELGKMLKEIREKYMDQIRDLRSKITISRKNA